MVDTSHVYVMGPHVEGGGDGWLIATAIAVGPRTILCCALSLHLSSENMVFEADRWVRSAVYEDRYFVQQVVTSNNGKFGTNGRIPLLLHQFSVEDNWAVLVRSDGGVFGSYAKIHVPKAFPLVHQPVVLLHFPDIPLFTIERWEEELMLNVHATGAVIQSATSHHVVYSSNHTSPASAGGALYLASAPSEVFAMHCTMPTQKELEGNNDFDYMAYKTTDSAKRLKPVEPSPFIPSPDFIEDQYGDAAVKSTARALVISQFPQLVQAIQEANQANTGSG